MAKKSNISYNRYISDDKDKMPTAVGTFVNPDFVFKKEWEQPEPPSRCHENAFLMYHEIRKKEDAFIKNVQTKKLNGLAVRTVNSMSPRLNDFRDEKFTVSNQTAQTADGNNSIEWTGFFVPDETAMYQFAFTTGVPGLIWVGQTACYDFTEWNKHKKPVHCTKDNYCAVRFQYLNYPNPGNVDIVVTKTGGKLTNSSPFIPNFKTVIDSEGNQFFRKLMYYAFVGSGVPGRVHFYHNNGENYRQIQDSKKSHLVEYGRSISYSSPSEPTIERDEDAELIIQQTPLYKLEIVSAFFGNNKRRINVTTVLTDLANKNNGNVIIKSAKGEYKRLFGDPDPTIASFQSEVAKGCLPPTRPLQPRSPTKPQPPSMPRMNIFSIWFGGRAQYNRDMNKYYQDMKAFPQKMSVFAQETASYVQKSAAYTKQMIEYNAQLIVFYACQKKIKDMNDYLKFAGGNKLLVSVKKVAIGTNGEMYLNDTSQVVLDYNDKGNKNTELIVPIQTVGNNAVSNSTIELRDNGSVLVNGQNWITRNNTDEKNETIVQAWKGKSRSTISKNTNYEALFSQNGKYKLEYSKVLGKLIYKHARFPSIRDYTYGKNSPFVYTNIYPNITSPDQKKIPIAYYLYRPVYDEIDGEIWMNEKTDTGELLLTKMTLDDPSLKPLLYENYPGYPVPNQSSYTISANVPSMVNCKNICNESNKCGNYFYNPNSKECWIDKSSNINPIYNTVQDSKITWPNIYTKAYRMENQYQNEAVKRATTPRDYTIANNKLGAGTGVEGFSDIPERYLTKLKKRPDTNTEEGRINDLQVMLYQQNVLHSLSSIAAISFLVGAIVLARN